MLTHKIGSAQPGWLTVQCIFTVASPDFISFTQESILCTRMIAGAPGGTPEKLGGGVRPASQNPYPIYDQNLRYSLP